MYFYKYDNDEGSHYSLRSDKMYHDEVNQYTAAASISEQLSTFLEGLLESLDKDSLEYQIASDTAEHYKKVFERNHNRLEFYKKWEYADKRKIRKMFPPNKARRIIRNHENPKKEEDETYSRKFHSLI